ncbi:Hypothetical predicted protein [Marmota monax]|uniref:Mitochondrial import receptor subunit TOM6 homolog n=1 Tax=Marmota monax TaxID=9995 RepID=A0A5E4A7S3_MARMO|nr:hypothetical protein GHT09_010600 [Marmota monax]VTJ53313.1 Hypothetical predicted protein [Marmota monax]
MASSGVTVSAAGSANEAPEIPDNVGDWLRGVYRFATDRNDFRRNLILNLGLFAAGGFSQINGIPVLHPNLPKTAYNL